MLWPSESRRSCGEIRNVIILFVPHSRKIDYFDLIANASCFFAKNIIDFDVSVGYFIVMQVLHPFTDL